jgi:hypothetical protein
MIIVPAEENDLERILAIQREAYLSEAALYDDFTIPPLRQTLEDLRAECRTKVILKAVVEQELLGSVRVSLSGDTCLLISICAGGFRPRGPGWPCLCSVSSPGP